MVMSHPTPASNDALDSLVSLPAYATHTPYSKQYISNLRVLLNLTPTLYQATGIPFSKNGCEFSHPSTTTSLDNQVLLLSPINEDQNNDGVVSLESSHSCGPLPVLMVSPSQICTQNKVIL